MKKEDILKFNEWNGYVTPGNAELIARRLERLLESETYTLVFYNDGFYPQSDTGLTITTDIQLAPQVRRDGRAVWATSHDIHVADTSGYSWGISIEHGSEPKYEIVFTHNTAVFTDRSPSGNNLVTKIVVQSPW